MLLGAISSGTQSRALLPLKFPGVDQSEMIADKQSLDGAVAVCRQAAFPKLLFAD